MLKVKIMAEVELYTEESNLKDIKNNALTVLKQRLIDVKPTMKADQSNGGIVNIEIKEKE